MALQSYSCLCSLRDSQMTLFVSNKASPKLSHRSPITHFHLSCVARMFSTLNPQHSLQVNRLSWILRGGNTDPTIAPPPKSGLAVGFNYGMDAYCPPAVNLVAGQAGVSQGAHVGARHDVELHHLQNVLEDRREEVAQYGEVTPQVTVDHTRLQEQAIVPEKASHYRGLGGGNNNRVHPEVATSSIGNDRSNGSGIGNGIRNGEDRVRRPVSKLRPLPKGNRSKKQSRRDSLG